MKSTLIVLSALLMLAACDAPAPKEAGCAECEKMAVEAKAKHDAEKKAHGQGCECCKKKAAAAK